MWLLPLGGRERKGSRAGRGEGEEEITTTTAASPKTAGTHTQDEISLQKFTPSIINTQKTRHSLSLSFSLPLSLLLSGKSNNTGRGRGRVVGGVSVSFQPSYSLTHPPTVKWPKMTQITEYYGDCGHGRVNSTYLLHTTQALVGKCGYLAQ